jgi:ABC-type amino acid transport/signal transduction systems, periplasmic component/domain
MIKKKYKEKSDRRKDVEGMIKMKKLWKTVTALTMLTTMLAVTGCAKVPANKVNSIDDLPKKTIGVQQGTTGDIYSSDYEKQGSKIERYNKGADAIQALKQGKVDCVIIDNEPAKVFVSKNNDLKILSDPFVTEDYAISVSKKNTELKDKINKALGELKADGTLQKIIDNYIGENTGKSPYTSPANVDRSNGTLTMATNAEFPPYEYNENNKIVGIDADVAQAICDKLGMTLKIDDMSFDSIITAVQAGKADVGIAGMTVTKDRLKNIDFTDSYTTATQVIIVRKK